MCACVSQVASGVDDCLISPAMMANFCDNLAGSQYPDIQSNIILDVSRKVFFSWD